MSNLPVPKGYTGIIIAATLIFIAAAVYDFTAQTGNPLTIPDIKIGSTVTQNKEYVTVTRVVDGDTLVLHMNGIDEKVRLIGINTPEIVDPRKKVECFGKEASARMKELAERKTVYVEYDDTQSLRDMYGRLLAYVYLEDGQMLNRKMIAEGYAYEYTYLTPYKYQQEFKDVAMIARTSKRGLWADETCAGKK